MGLKKLNYTTRNTNVTLPEAYCLISYVELERDKAIIHAYVQASRQACKDYTPLEIFEVQATVDMALPIYEQMYTRLKEFLGEGWEDDIVEEVIDESTDEEGASPAEDTPAVPTEGTVDA